MRIGGRRIAMAVLATMWAGGCADSQNESVREARSAAGPQKRMRRHESLMRGMRLRQIDSGKLEVELEAREAWLVRGGRLLNAHHVRATYYGEEGKSANLKADHARYDTDRLLLRAWGRVRVEAEGMTLETPSLVWDGVDGRASGEERVRVTKGANVTTGTGFEWDPLEEKVSIREVEANIQHPQEFEPLVDALKEK